jgi:hypothetical protein
MRTIVIASLFIALVFSLPLPLSFFIDTYVGNSIIYFLFYMVIMTCSFISGLVLYILAIFVKNEIIKRLYVFLAIMFGICLINFSISMIIPKSVLMDLPKGSNYEKFNSQVWQNAPSKKVEIRQYMLKDLVQNNLIGKNREQIKAMLGSPDKEEGNYMYYSMGMERSFFSIDPELLTIFFDSNNIFERYEIWQG